MDTFIPGLGSNLLAELIGAAFLAWTAWMWTKRASFGKSLAKYKYELRHQLKGMPFIYRDLEGDVLNDFVEIEIHALDTDSRQRKDPTRTALVDEDRLRRSRRVIFLGDAGIGKTTFQRYAILRILSSRTAPFVYPREAPIPIYIPLKMVDSSVENPITTFLLQSHGLFKGRRGARRLLKYANQKRLFLFLDGYDEIAAGTATHLKAELKALFSARRRDWSLETADLYDSLRSCRVWLTSRREFFEHNLFFIPSPKDARAETVAAVELGGIGANRPTLTRNIFDKYKRRSQKYSDLLSDEYFISDIDRSIDPELRKLSFNPLFLTVMCYVYVQKVIAVERYDVSWLESFDDLIMQCVRLLLIDLDEAKARDLPPAHQQAIIRRRNAYAEEKNAFLMFFAAQLLFDGVGAFRLQDLREAVRSFLAHESDWPTQAEILEHLDRQGGAPDFALQLIYAGVFTAVSRIKDELFYDFPHRRFREVLALRYISTPQRYWRALPEVGRPYFEEFVRLLRRNTAIQRSDFQLAALQHILDRAVESPMPERDVIVTRNFFDLIPPGVAVEPVISGWLKRTARDAAPRFEVAATIVHECRNDEMAAHLVVVLEDGLNSGSPERCGMSLRALEKGWPPVGEQALRRFWQQLMKAPVIRVTAVEVALTLAPDLAFDHIRQVQSDADAMNDFLYSCARNVCRHFNPGTSVRLWEALPNSDRFRWLGFVARFASSKFAELTDAVQWKGEREWFEVIAKLDAKEVEASFSKRHAIHIVTEMTLKAADKIEASLGTAYVKANVKRKVKRAGSFRSVEVESEIDAKVPASVFEIAEWLRDQVQTDQAKLLPAWPSIKEKVHNEVMHAITFLTFEDADETVAAMRTPLRPGEIGHFILDQVDSSISVPPSIFMAIHLGRDAWDYHPPNIPDYFV